MVAFDRHPATAGLFCFFRVLRIGQPMPERCKDDNMELQHDTWALCQSEKVKAGLVWTSSAVEMSLGLEGAARQGAQRIICGLIAMVAGEVHLARKLSRDDTWLAVDKSLNMARVMVNSGVAHEATFHLARALSEVTSIGRRAAGNLESSGK